MAVIGDVSVTGARIAFFVAFVLFIVDFLLLVLGHPGFSSVAGLLLLGLAFVAGGLLLEAD